jgi:hypothetical protein
MKEWQKVQANIILEKGNFGKAKYHMALGEISF